MMVTFRNDEDGFRIWFKEFIESLRHLAGSWQPASRSLEESTNESSTQL